MLIILVLATVSLGTIDIMNIWTTLETLKSAHVSTILAPTLVLVFELPRSRSGSSSSCPRTLLVHGRRALSFRSCSFQHGILHWLHLAATLFFAGIKVGIGKVGSHSTHLCSLSGSIGSQLRLCDWVPSLVQPRFTSAFGSEGVPR